MCKKTLPNVNTLTPGAAQPIMVLQTEHGAYQLSDQCCNDIDLCSSVNDIVAIEHGGNRRANATNKQHSRHAWLSWAVQGVTGQDCCLLTELTLNDLCGGTTRSVAFEGCISISRLLQQVTQLLTRLQLVLLHQRHIPHGISQYKQMYSTASAPTAGYRQFGCKPCLSN